MTQYPSRRTIAALLGVLTFLGFGGCGPAATTTISTPAVGTSDRASEVDVLNAVVVSTRDGRGTLVATLVNNNDDEAAQLTRVSAASPGVSRVSRTGVRIPADGLVDLSNHVDSDEVPRIRVAGDFAQGDFVQLSFTFGDGSEATLGLPVVPNDGYYAGLDDPASAETQPIGPEESKHGEGH